MQDWEWYFCSSLFSRNFVASLFPYYRTIQYYSTFTSSGSTHQTQTAHIFSDTVKQAPWQKPIEEHAWNGMIPRWQEVWAISGSSSSYPQRKAMMMMNRNTTTISFHSWDSRPQTYQWDHPCLKDLSIRSECLLCLLVSASTELHCCSAWKVVRTIQPISHPWKMSQLRPLLLPRLRFAITLEIDGLLAPPPKHWFVITGLLPRRNCPMVCLLQVPINTQAVAALTSLPEDLSGRCVLRKCQESLFEESCDSNLYRYYS